MTNSINNFMNNWGTPFIDAVVAIGTEAADELINSVMPAYLPPIPSLNNNT